MNAAVPPFELASQKGNVEITHTRNFFLLCVVLASLCELVFLACLFQQIDWNDPLQRLVFITTGLIYGTLGMAVVALGAYHRWLMLHIMQAIESSPSRASVGS